MEDILAKLLVADNSVIEQGTAELREAFKKPESTPILCQIIVSSSNPDIRQYAGVLLRKRFVKAKHWSKLPINIRTEVKAILLRGLVNEPEKNVKNTIAQIVAAIVKHELPNNTWPELFQFIQQLVASNNLLEKELGMLTLSKMTGVAPEIYLTHAESLMTLLVQTFTSLQQQQYGNLTGYYIIKTMENLAPLVEGNQIMVNAYHEMIPLAILTIQSLIENNNDNAINSMDIFDELLEQSTVISPHIKNIVPMCLIIAKNNTLDENLRVKSVDIIASIAKVRTRTLVKNKLIEPIVGVLFELLSSKSDNDEDDDDYDDDDVTTLLSCSTGVIHILAMNLKPDKLMPHLLKYIEPSIQSNDNYAKKASYLSMAVLAEGCSDYIRTKYLEDFLRCICQGINDKNQIVRNAALYALGQFSQHLQPEISLYAQQLLPVLFDYLGQMCEQLKQGKKKIPSAHRLFFALEIFCENLNDALTPYLPILMEKIFIILETKSSIALRELALSAISATANAAKENLLPYFTKIMTILDVYLTNTNNTKNGNNGNNDNGVDVDDDNDNDDESSPNALLVQSLDTLGVLARTIGENNFMPFLTKSLDLGITLIKNDNDPDIRKGVYGLFASLSALTKKDMAPILPQILDYIINSIQSSEGVVTHYKDDDDNTPFTVFENFSDYEKENEDEEDIENTDNEDDKDDDDDDVAGYSVVNSYIEEKEEAILALREIAHHTEEAFMPYIEKSFEEVFKSINYPQENIRKASIEALVQFCINLSKINTQDGKNALLKAISVFVPKLSEIIRLDDDVPVVITALEGFSELLKEIKEPVVIGEGHKEAVINCIQDIFNGKTVCQDEDEPDCDEDDEAEQDEYLSNCAGDLLSSLGKAIQPDEFLIYFQKMYPYLKSKIKYDTQRSFAIGTIGECLISLKHNTSAYVTQLYPLFKMYLEDESPEVRNNAYYALGELVYHGKESLYPSYNEILQLLAINLQKEDSPGPRDNMTGVIARLIITNYSLVDLERVFPVFVQQLPLKQDYEEYKSVFKCILTLYQSGNEIIKPYIQSFLKISISLLHEKKIDDEETKNLLVEYINSCQRDFTHEWTAVLSELSPEIQQTFSS